MRYRQKKDVVARAVAGANLLIPVNGASSVYTLNETGCRLWELITQPQTEGHLADSLLQHYEISLEEARRDVRSFLDDMVCMNLVERVT